MEPITAVIATGVVTVALFLLCIFNFARLGKSMFDGDSFDGKSFGNGFAIHVISSGLVSLSATLFICSLVWMLLDKIS